MLQIREKSLQVRLKSFIIVGEKYEGERLEMTDFTKRLFAILIFLTLSLSLLSACDGQGNAVTTEVPQVTAENEHGTETQQIPTPTPELNGEPTSAPVLENVFYVRKRTNGYDIDQKPEYEAYDDLEEAKKYCDKFARYGCIVCDSNYKCIYAPYSEVASEILYQAKLVCDFIRDEHFSYGNAPVNPAFDHSAYLVSCDRLVDWVLYRVGFTNQPYQSGKCVNGPGLTNWCKEQGFTKISKLADIKPGDIVFVNPKSNGDPQHVFICAGGGTSQYYRYDAGSNARIQSTQPSNEVISNFMYAYRATEMPAKSGVKYATEVPAAPTFKPDKQYTEVFADNFDGELNWKADHDITGMTVKDGELRITCGGTGDPYFTYDGTLDLDCSEITTMRVRIKNGSSSNVFQVFFITDSTPKYCAEAMVSVNLKFTRCKDFENSGWEEVEIRLAANKLWKGTLKGLRIDPVAGKGEVRIDSISFGKADK